MFEKISVLTYPCLILLFSLSVTAATRENNADLCSHKRHYADLSWESDESQSVRTKRQTYVVPPSTQILQSPSAPASLWLALNATEVVDCGDPAVTCARSRYRSYDGSCNNLRHPTWGRANTRYDRLLRPIYADGVSSPSVGQSGRGLPPARLVSFTLFPDKSVSDPLFTLVTMQYGQIVTHDMGLSRGTIIQAPPTTCCTAQRRLVLQDLSLPTCFPITIPPTDPVYTQDGSECLPFLRTETDRGNNCQKNYGYAEQINAVTSFLDLSIIYGSSDQVAAQLRAGVAGRLVVDVRANQEWLPPNANKTQACNVQSNMDVCYTAGDQRVNQNPQLTVIHTLLWREHNRIAGALAQLNPHWTDEMIFQEARRINIAIHQHISYYEWLPIIIGTENALAYGIISNEKGYVNDYDPTVNPSTINEHSNAAFRYFHTNIRGFLALVPERRCSSSCPFLRLSDHFQNPGVLEEGDNFDNLARGLNTQLQRNTDQFFTSEVTQFLFRRDRPLGSDLRAIDIQRNRDHGLATYNDFREYCGLPRARKWTDYQDWISAENVALLQGLYESVDDVDLTVGGSLESHVKGTLSGPTFLCILVKQFRKARLSDRFWYETPDQEVGFTPAQLLEIRKASISRLMCDNGNNIQMMQRFGFMAVSPSNPLVRCKDLPSVDLSLWADPRPETNYY